MLSTRADGQDSEMRITVFTLWAFGGLAVIADTPTITGVTAQQRYPWNGKVDISYTITGDIAATAKEKGLITSLKVSALDQVTGLNYAANMSALSGDMGLEAGNHKLVWDMDAEGFEFKSSNVVFTVSCEVTPALYCVIDLSAGAEALLYPVTYLTETPSSGFNVDEYKTTKLVLRRIEPGSFKMCGQYDVTLTKAYYMGVFEITQKQYELVTGNNPSQYKGDMRPVEYVSWNTIRGNSLNYNWPSTANVDLSTFIGKIQTHTGLSFDLPLEAQWEYACRAGTTSQYNNGGNLEDDLRMLGRYDGNQTDGKGGYSDAHTVVGSYQPNAWGLYDMHGNVWELCLDGHGDLSTGMTDPVGPFSSGIYRMRRGGSYGAIAGSCTSSIRFGDNPWYEYNNLGFRIARTLSE